MRSADPVRVGPAFVARLLRTAGLAGAAALLGACASFGGKAPAEAPSAPSQQAAAKAAPAKEATKEPTKEPTSPAAGAGKATAAPAPKPEPPPPPVNPAVQRAFDAARQALAAGRIAEAERGFAALAKSNPELAGPHANLGLVHRQAGRYPEAMAALQRAIDLNPQRADLHNQLGIAQRMAGDFAKAKASYERAIALDANYAPALLNLGILYDLYLWDGERALELYDRFLQLTPAGDEQVKRWISDLKNRAGNKRAEQRKEQG